MARDCVKQRTADFYPFANKAAKWLPIAIVWADLDCVQPDLSFCVDLTCRVTRNADTAREDHEKRGLRSVSLLNALVVRWTGENLADEDASETHRSWLVRQTAIGAANAGRQSRHENEGGNFKHWTSRSLTNRA
jgi:hypothetical protein